MECSADEIAGIVDLFGVLTRSELEQALSELAFKRAEEIDDVDALVDDAIASYHLVGIEREDRRLLAPGPTAFPELPDGAEDLPHILEVPDRAVDRETLVEAVAERFRGEVAVAVRSDNEAFVDRLLDVSYELETWGAIDVSGARSDLLAARGEPEEAP